MALNFHVSLRNSLLDQIETFCGASAFFQMYSGAKPSSASSAVTGATLIKQKVPISGGGDWLAAASGGTKAKNGTWNFTATRAGTAGYFRINKNNGGTMSNCLIQGSVATTGADLNLNNCVFTAGQTVTVTGFVLTGGNA